MDIEIVIGSKETKDQWTYPVTRTASEQFLKESCFEKLQYSYIVLIFFYNYVTLFTNVKQQDLVIAKIA